MKKMYTLFILFCSISFFGQNISFTDTNFKAVLLAANTSNSIAKDINLNPMKIDTNIDGEISEAEALAVYHLDVSTAVGQNMIANVLGIENFLNLVSLNCSNQMLTQINVSMLSNLKKLVANKNQLTNVLLPQTNPQNFFTSNLEFLALERNLINQIDLTNIPLRKVFLGFNQFSQLTDINLESFVGYQLTNNSQIQMGIISINNNPNLSFVKLPYSTNNTLNIEYFLDIENTNLSANILTELAPNLPLNFNQNKKDLISGLNMLGTPLNDSFFIGFPPTITMLNNYTLGTRCLVFGNKKREFSPTDYSFYDFLNIFNTEAILDGDYPFKLFRYATTGLYETIANTNNVTISNYPFGMGDDFSNGTGTTKLIMLGNIHIDGTSINQGNSSKNIEEFYIMNNESIITTEFSHYIHLLRLNFYNCPNLQGIHHKAPYFSNGLTFLRLENTPNLQSVCVNDATYAQNNWQNSASNSNFQYTDGPYCSTVYNGNVLRGNVFYNYNSINYPINKWINFTRTNSVNSYYSYSPNYELKAFGDTYTITPLGSLGANFTIDNASKTQIVPDLFEPNLVNDFTITKTNTVHDLALTIYQGNPPVQNETFNLIVNVQNLGTELDNCYVDVDYDNSRLTFTSSNPMFSLPYPNTIRIAIGNSIIPFNTYCYTIPFTVGIPPAVLVGDALVFNAQLTNQSFAADNNPNNNANTTAIVVGSYDPNDKICFEGDTITTDETDEFLTYRVRFQNDGNWYARNIVVTDVIDTKLDMDTFELVGSSHDVKIRSNPENPRKLEFVFRNINLNWSSQNLEESQGYFIYKIKPNADAVEGSSIENTAAIYFDYNDPIITNTATTMVESTMGLNDNEQIKINLLPNPCTNFVQIETEEKIEKVEIYDALGRMVITQLSGNTIVDLSQILSGNYFVKIYLEDNRIVAKKIIKQ